MNLEFIEIGGTFYNKAAIVAIQPHHAGRMTEPAPDDEDQNPKAIFDTMLIFGNFSIVVEGNPAEVVKQFFE